MNNVVMDTSNIVLWVSVCVSEEYECNKLYFDSIFKLAIWKAYKSKIYILLYRLIRFVF